jgi:hypothetical protein
MTESERHVLRLSLKRRLVDLLDAQAVTPSEHGFLSDALIEERDIRHRLTRLDMADALRAELASVAEQSKDESIGSIGEIVSLDSSTIAQFVDGRLTLAVYRAGRPVAQLALTVSAWNELLEFAFAKGGGSFRHRILDLVRQWQTEQDDE